MEKFYSEIKCENKPERDYENFKAIYDCYKNVRIWTRLDLGTGYRKDLFMTTADNQPIGEVIDLFNSSSEVEISWKEQIDD